MKRGWLIAMILVGVLGLQGCIWWAPDDDDEYERVYYHNHTRWDVDCWIDDEYVGRVRSYDTMKVRDEDWDGWHDYYSEAVDENIHWGPDEFHMDDGDTLHIDLIDDGWTMAPAPRSPAETLGQ